MTECGLKRRCYECQAFLPQDASIICATVAAFSTYLVVNGSDIAAKIDGSLRANTSEEGPHNNKKKSMIAAARTRLGDRGVFVSTQSS